MSNPPSENPHETLKDWLAKLSLISIWILLIGVITPQIFALFQKSSWFLELFSHYVVYYALIDFFLIFFLLWQRMYKATIGIALLFAVQVSQLIPYLVPPDPVTASGPEVSIMSYNFHVENTQFDELYTLISSVQPDIVVIHEAAPEWEEEILRYSDLYPYQAHTEEFGPFGMVILSKYEATFEELDFTGRHSLEALIQIDDQFLRVIGFHPAPPINEPVHAEWVQNFQELSALISDRDLITPPSIVVGDFNCTPWSHHFEELTHNTGLYDAQIGYGLSPTWNDWIWWLKIPIDHILVDPNMAVLDFEVIDHSGSDHLPVLAVLQLP